MHTPLQYVCVCMFVCSNLSLTEILFAIFSIFKPKVLDQTTSTMVKPLGQSFVSFLSFTMPMKWQQDLGVSCTMARIKSNSSYKVHCWWQRHWVWNYWHQGICGRRCFQEPCPRPWSCYSRWSSFSSWRESSTSLPRNFVLPE